MKPKRRNPVAQALHEERAFKLKVHNPKKKPPPEPTVTEALEILEEDESLSDCVDTFSKKNVEEDFNDEENSG